MSEFLTGSEIADKMEWEGKFYSILECFSSYNIENKELAQLFLQFKDLNREITDTLKDLYPDEDWY